MHKKKHINRKKADPKALSFTGTKYTENPMLQLFKYNDEEIFEEANYKSNNFSGIKSDGYQYWLNVHGLHDVDLIFEICGKANVDSLLVQDIVDVNQRPKFQEFNEHFFFSIKSMLPATSHEIEIEQLSFVVGDNFLISFQEKKGDHFHHIRERLREHLGRVREKKVDYLLFLLFESILDNYFKTLSEMEATLETDCKIQPDEDPSPKILSQIESLQKDLNQIRKTLFPIRDFVNRAEREQLTFIDPQNVKYFFELKDLTLTLLDDCDQLENKLESRTNLFFSIQGQRMNQVMKILTIVSTIFIPTTFIAGIYGMNFDLMPELHWKYGYLAVWGVMIALFFFMLRFFKKRNWF